MVIAGGCAGDNAKFHKTYLFDEKRCSEEACVVATLSGEALIVKNEDNSLFKRVDNAMYVAKENGRNRYVVG